MATVKTDDGLTMKVEFVGHDKEEEDKVIVKVTAIDGQECLNPYDVKVVYDDIVFDNDDQAPKYDDGKTQFDLVPFEPLEELAKVYMSGAAKYGRNSWRGGFKYGRIFSAIVRHCGKWLCGETYDPEDGLHHLAHACWNCFTLIYMDTYYDDYGHMDDRNGDSKK